MTESKKNKKKRYCGWAFIFKMQNLNKCLSIAHNTRKNKMFSLKGFIHVEQGRVIQIF